MKECRHILYLFAAVLVSLSSSADDWPNWRGPTRDGVSTETEWSHEWPESGPTVAWRANVSRGFSSVAVADGRVYTMGNTGTKPKAEQEDIIACLDAGSGKVLWKHVYKCPLAPKYYEGGTSATPTLHDGRAYTISKNGLVFCLEAASGDVLWQRDLCKEHGLELPTWGFAGSVLVLNDLLVLNAGTHGIALNRKDGSLRWSTGKEKAGYSTPVEYLVAERVGLAIFGERTLAGVDALTGDVLWEIGWRAKHDENIADPIILGGMMLVPSFLGNRCSYFKLNVDGLTEKWRNKEMLSWMSSAVARQGHLYGMDARRKALRCMEIETGKIVWSQGGFGLGQLILAGERLIALSDKGKLVIAEASPEAYRELASAQVVKGKCWTDPVLANGRIYVRTWAGELVCLSVAGE